VSTQSMVFCPHNGLDSLDEICRTIVNDDPRVLRIDGEAALALPSLLREQGLSAIAKAWIEEGRLVLPLAVAAAIEADADAMAAWVETVDAECERLGRLVQTHRDRLSPPVLLKGAAVARRYHRPQDRTYEDVDLLVPAAELATWAQALASMGYRVPSSGPSPLPWRHAVTYAWPERVGPLGPLECDIHTCMAIERHAQAFAYGAVRERAESSPFPGLLWPSKACVLVLLAVHLLRNPPPYRKWICTRDVVELADPATATAARALAARAGLGWALEHVLSLTAPLLPTAVRPTQPIPLQPRLSLAGVYQRGFPGYLFVLALGREMGARTALRYVATKVAPRTFVSPQGLDVRVAAHRLGRIARRAGQTFGAADRSG
jgi:hypothetical protein